MHLDAVADASCVHLPVEPRSAPSLSAFLDDMRPDWHSQWAWDHYADTIKPTCPSTLPSCRRREMIGAPLLPAQCNRSERVHKALFCTRTEAKEAVFEYTEVFYDRHRLPSALARISHTFC